MHVSVIIISYNTKDLLKQCLDSIITHTTDIDYEILVSDNGSSDGTIEMLSQYPFPIHLIKNNENLGFGAANNRALSYATGKYIFYLNSDTILLNNAIKLFYDYWENASPELDIGALGANLLNQRQEIIHSYAQFPQIKTEIKNKLHAVYRVLKINFLSRFIPAKLSNTPSNSVHSKYIGLVDYITGADLFIKNTPFARFDERYFMYCEDVDLSYQLYKHNLNRYLIDGPQIIHLEGGSSIKEIDEVKKYKSFSNIYNSISKVIFFKKNKSPYVYIFILKCCTTLLWCMPSLFPHTKKYLKILWKI